MRCSKRYAWIGTIYSINSSARMRRDNGNSMPSALAVLRLMKNSTFVGCSTGSSGLPRKRTSPREARAIVRFAPTPDVPTTTRLVESRCGAVALGRTYLLPPLSSGRALVVQPWLRFHIPLIEPDMRISRIRLSDKNSCFRVQRLLQFLTSFRS